MSIAGGLYKSIERGDELKCESIQVFVQSSRTWKSEPLSDETIRLFRAALASAKTVKRVVAHNSYLLNISTADAAARKKSVAYFVDILEKCDALGIESLITHPGSHMGAGEAEGLKHTAHSLDEVMKAAPGLKTRILLENTAGQGGCLGHCFEHLREIVDRTSQPERIAFCFDTEHAFAAGYDLRTPEAYEETFRRWDEQLGVANIRAFHVNDAVKDLGCRVDRHANIGTGFLGKEAFRPLVNDQRFMSTPMCLETEPGEENGNWKRELKLLRKLVSGSATAF